MEYDVADYDALLGRIRHVGVGLCWACAARRRLGMRKFASAVRAGHEPRACRVSSRSSTPSTAAGSGTRSPCTRCSAGTASTASPSNATGSTSIGSSCEAGASRLPPARDSRDLSLTLLPRGQEGDLDPRPTDLARACFKFRFARLLQRLDCTSALAPTDACFSSTSGYEAETRVSPIGRSPGMIIAGRRCLP